MLFQLLHFILYSVYPVSGEVAAAYGDAGADGAQRVFEKTAGTAADTACSVIVIDRAGRKIHCVNYGAGIDREVSY